MKFETCLFLLVTIFTISFAEAKDEIAVKSSSEFSKIKFNEIAEQTGSMLSADKFLESSYKNTLMGKEIPNVLSEQFDNDSRLIIHSAVFKIPKNYTNFITSTLKSKTSVEKNLFFNSKIISLNDSFAPCTTLVGSIISDMNIPKFFSAFNFPDKLECEITIANAGTGKHFLRKEVLDQFQKDLKDSDVRYLALNFTNCNMIFKGMAQNLYLIKAVDGNTIIFTDNYSLVKKTTLDKLNSVSLFTGSPLSFINDQVKKNMLGLLKYLNSVK
jgi:hypothetical protein